MTRQSLVLILLLMMTMLLSQSVYWVDQTDQALVFQMGHVVRVDKTPGLYFKWPVLQSVRDFDIRILTLDPSQSEQLKTSDQQSVLLDYYAKWRVIDVQKYQLSVGGDETRAASRLLSLISIALHDEFTLHTEQQVVSGDRAALTQPILVQLNQTSAALGIQVIDLRIQQMSLPADALDATYQRMNDARTALTKQLQASLVVAATKMRVEADVQQAAIVLKGSQDVQRIKGEGDAQASAIYATVAQGHADFFAFYRSLEIYRQSMNKKSDVLLLDSRSPFFKYMNPVQTGKQ